MTTYLVSYDLRAPGKNYDSLIEHLKSYGTYWHNLGSTWFVVTDKTAAQVRDSAQAHMDSNDQVVVCASNAPGAWAGFDSSASNWLKTHLS